MSTFISSGRCLCLKLLTAKMSTYIHIGMNTTPVTDNDNRATYDCHDDNRHHCCVCVILFIYLFCVMCCYFASYVSTVRYVILFCVICWYMELCDIFLCYMLIYGVVWYNFVLYVDIGSCVILFFTFSIDHPRGGENTLQCVFHINWGMVDAFMYRIIIWERN